MQGPGWSSTEDDAPKLAIAEGDFWCQIPPEAVAEEKDIASIDFWLLSQKF